MLENKEFLGSEGYSLMGAAFEVHKELGGGLSEELYQESLVPRNAVPTRPGALQAGTIELGLRGIPFSSKNELEVYYKGQCLRKKYIPDLLVCRVPSVATS